VERLVDADGHVFEPPDMWERWIDPAHREGCIRVRRLAEGDRLEIAGRPARLTTPEMLAGMAAMGKTIDEISEITLSRRYAENLPAAATDPAARLALLDQDGLSHAILYPSVALQWEAEVEDPAYALAHARAYNRWIEAFCHGSGGRLVPIAHLPLGDVLGAAQELERAVKAGARGGFVAPFTLSGLPHGHPAHDPLWAVAQDLDVPIAIHTAMDPSARGVNRRFDDVDWPGGMVSGGFYLQIMFPQAVQQAFSTFFHWGTFDRFPRLRLAVLESGASWLPYWTDRMDALFRTPLRVTTVLRDPPGTYVRRQCWISADPDERLLGPVIDHIGADRFVWASDYPHSDHGGDYMDELRSVAASLSPEARRGLLGENAARLYRLV
jgi:predicted TIM-barrel fold metal-dependent hydrolase